MEEMLVKRESGFLSGNALKIIAVISMTADHFGMIFFSDVMIYRAFGRLAFPIFAYMIAEGCTYTKNRMKYFLLIFGTGILCQIFYFVFDKSLGQCILITFSLSLIIIFSFRFAQEKKKPSAYILVAAAVLFALFFCEGLKKIVPAHYGFKVDYGFAGVFLPVLIYFGNSKREKLILTAIGLFLVCLNLSYIQLFSFTAIIPLAMYNGERGKLKLKYFFYVYYPTHLALMYIIDTYIVC